MSSDKPTFLSQPVVKNLFMFRNGDPYFEARRIVINEKRVGNFETLLREVTGGIQAPFGAVRTIYTPRGGHRVDRMESLQSGEQYVAAGKERFKKLELAPVAESHLQMRSVLKRSMVHPGTKNNWIYGSGDEICAASYLQIGPRKKKMMQTLPVQARPLPPNRIIVSARFLKPIKEPCPIFVVANGDVLNPVMRFLIHQRMMGQFDKILELITEKMGLRVLGGVRSLFTYEGHQVTDGNKLECGQLYVAVGRERFKKLPYSDLLFPRPKGTRRIKGMKAYSLPPIYRFAKHRGNSKSTVRSSDSGDGESKGSPPNHSSSGKEHLSSAVREISQARLLSLRKRKSGQSITDNDDPESRAGNENTDGETLQDVKTEEKSDADDQNATKENNEETEERVGNPSENCSDVDVSANQEDKNENQNTNTVKEEEIKAADEKKEEATAEHEKKVEEVKEIKEKVTEENQPQVNGEGQESNSSAVSGDQTEDDKEKKDGLHTFSETEREQDTNTKVDDQEKEGSNRKESSNINDEESGEEQKTTENNNNNSPDETQSGNEQKENQNGRNNSSHQEGDLRKTNEEPTKDTEEEERTVNGEVSGDSDEAKNEKNSDSCLDVTLNEEKQDVDDEKSKIEKD